MGLNWGLAGGKNLMVGATMKVGSLEDFVITFRNKNDYLSCLIENLRAK